MSLKAVSFLLASTIPLPPNPTSPYPFLQTEERGAQHAAISKVGSQLAELDTALALCQGNLAIVFA